MKTRSLILSPHEARAALDGRLGLVVRPVKPQPFGGESTYQSLNIHGQHLFYPTSEDESAYDKDDGLRRCPLGVPGTRLCCKETWAELDGGVTWKATEPGSLVEPPGWRSPATMPAWASRITLEVVGVRCVRVKELTGEDAVACGFSWTGEPGQYGDGCQSPFSNLEDVWTAKYATRYPWETSWAWAVGVRRVEG